MTVEELLAEREQWHRERDEYLQQIRNLSAQIRALREKLFGSSKGEKVDHTQLRIELELAEAELLSLHGCDDTDRRDSQIPPAQSAEIEELVSAGSEEKTEPEQRSKRYSLPKDIEERTERMVPEEVLANPDAYHEIGDPEVTEIIDIEPVKFVRIRQEYPRFVRKDDRTLPPIRAERPERVLLGGLASVRLLVHVILAKYLEHMPLYRQEQSFKQRCSVQISRKTMGGWVKHVAEDWLLILYESIKNDVRCSLYIRADETPILCLDQESSKGSRKGYLWVYVDREGQCVYEWHMGRAAKCAQSMLHGYRGLLQSDGYAAYEHHSAKEGFLQVGCMAHARRKFHEAWRDYDERQAGWYILRIGELYEVEAKLRANPKLNIIQTRKEESLPILKQIEERLHADIETLEPSSRTYQAVQYARNAWPKLCRYASYPEVQIDNNAAERALRPSKLGMKNWLFVGHPQAGQRAAIIYTILQNCKNHGVDPQAYLCDVLQKLPKLKNDEHAIRQLQPRFWKKTI